ADMIARHGPRPMAMVYTYPHDQVDKVLAQQHGKMPAATATASAGYIGAASAIHGDSQDRVATLTTLKLNFKPNSSSRVDDSKASAQRSGRVPFPVAGVE